MQNTFPRRQFLTQSVLTLTGFGLAANRLTAIEPFKRSGGPRMALSLAAYSFRDSFKENAPRHLDMFQFVDYCADHGCAGAEVTSYYFPNDADDDYLLRLRRHAFLRGIELSGTAVGNEFTNPDAQKRREQIAHVKAWVDRAYVLGAPHIRVFAGQARGTSKEEAKKQCIAAIEECSDYAGTKGVFLGLENHGGIVAEADDLLDIVKAVNSRWFGVNLDTGNFNTEDPYGDLARCAPYAVNVQYKVEMRKRGQPKEPADFARILKLLRAANYQGYVALEYEAAPDPWDHVPGILKQMKELMDA